jgi:hypothetical protein
MMSPTPDDAKAVLYTPYGGLELFDSHADLLDSVAERLKQPRQRSDCCGSCLSASGTHCRWTRS